MVRRFSIIVLSIVCSLIYSEARSAVIFLDENENRFANTSGRVAVGLWPVCENAVSQDTSTGCQNNDVSDAFFFPPATEGAAFSTTVQLISDFDAALRDGVADNPNISNLDFNWHPELGVPLIERLFAGSLISYTPTEFQPGHPLDGQPVDTYVAQSDCSSDGSCPIPAPEPSSAALLLGVLGILLVAYRSHPPHPYFRKN